MIRKSLTILSLIGLLLSVGLWGVSCYGIGYLRNDYSDKEMVAGEHFLGHQVGVYLNKGVLSWGWCDYYDHRGRHSSETFGKIYPHTKWYSRRDVLSRDWPGDFFIIAWSGWDRHRSSFRWLPWCFLAKGTMNGALPLHILCIVFLIPIVPGLARSAMRRKRKKLGLCLKCGYDLRASKDICPECGEAMQENPAPATMADGHDEPDHT